MCDNCEKIFSIREDVLYMRLFILQTCSTDIHGGFNITFHKHLFLHVEDAFAEAKKLGKDTCVLELTQTDCWNYEAILKNECM